MANEGSFWSRNRSAARDAEVYRNGYPNGSDVTRLRDNLLFYSNQLPSSPSGDLIDNVHRKWFGDYALLERHHGYIQWIFPIREHGMNGEAQVLQPHESKHIRESVECSRRIVASYRLMLDFYGMVLLDEVTGRIGRHPTNWKSRYDNLSLSSHNWLRVTRILKCLGEMGYEHYKAPFMALIFEEVYEGKRPLKRCESSACYFWLAVLRSDDQRAEFVQKVDAARERLEGAKRVRKPSTKPKAVRSFWSNHSDSDDDDDEQPGKDDGKTDDAKANISSPAVAPSAATAVVAAPPLVLSAWYPSVACTGYPIAAYLTTLPPAAATASNGFAAIVASAAAASSSSNGTSGVSAKKSVKKCPAKGCGKPASKICGRCRKIWFCSPACQQAHWQLHKSQCEPSTATAAASSSTSTSTAASSPAVASSSSSSNGVIMVAAASPAAAAVNNDGVAVHGYSSRVAMSGTADHDDTKQTADGNTPATTTTAALPPPPAAAL